MRVFLILLTAFTFIGVQAAAEDLPLKAGMTWIQQEDALLLEAREPRPCSPDTELPCERLWKIYGDGRLALKPGPSWMEDGVQLGEEAVEQLLDELDQLLDLPAHGSEEPVPERGPYLRIRLKHYHSADWSVATDYLTAVVFENLDPAFSQLKAVLRWLSYREQAIVFRSGNPWPEICRAKRRAELGIRSELPVWCRDLMRRSGLTFRGAVGVIEPDEAPFKPEDRERIRQRLRERLRSLPRSSPPP